MTKARSKKASPSTPAAHVNETESATESSIDEQKAEGLPASVSSWTDQDLANVAALRALRFTAPATLDDCIEAHKYAHAMKWSSRPRVDFMLNSERGVKMRVELGNAFVETTFDAE